MPMSVCKFLMPAWPSRRCHSQPSEAFASRHTAVCGPVEKSIIYKSPLLKPSKTLEWLASMITTQRYLPKTTTISRSQSIETDMRFYPKDSTSMTLSMWRSFEIATLPRPNTWLFPLSAKMICFRCDGDKGASINRFLSPVMWFVHPLSRTHSLALGWSSCRWISATYELIYFISEEYDINIIRSISSSNSTDKSVWGREKWKFISSWLACVLSGIVEVSSKFFRRFEHVWRPDPA